MRFGISRERLSKLLKSRANIETSLESFWIVPRFGRTTVHAWDGSLRQLLQLASEETREECLIQTGGGGALTEREGVLFDASLP